MTLTAKFYLGIVIGAGGACLAAGLFSGDLGRSTHFLLFGLAVLVASVVKVRLPAMSATYSLSALVLLFGIFQFTLAETLIAGCLASLAQSLWNTKTKPDLLRASFNVANQAISLALCYTMANHLRAIPLYAPAIFVTVATTYFAINTGLTSGAVALVGGQSLAETFGEWYVWTAPYYLMGAAVVGVFAGGHWMDAKAWLILLPLLYLVHFFTALSKTHDGATAGSNAASKLPPRASAYIRMVIVAGAMLGVAGLLGWQVKDPLKLVVFGVLTAAASVCKIRLPGITGTLSLNFVVLIVAISELDIWEAVFLGAVAAVVQGLWRPKQRPVPVQVAFNAACLMLSTALAAASYVLAAQYAPPGALLALLVPATLVLYAGNTVMVAVVLCLIEDKPFSYTWTNCNFWTLPYYLVGTVTAALMITSSHSTGWYSSALVLPAMVMVYASYNQHVARTVA